MMKYLLLLVVLLLGVWLWKRNRSTEARERPLQRAPRPAPPPPPASTEVTEMVACLHCGLHLPAHEAVAGQHGPYCSQAHRQAREG